MHRKTTISHILNNLDTESWRWKPIAHSNESDYRTQLKISRTFDEQLDSLLLVHSQKVWMSISA